MNFDVSLYDDENSVRVFLIVSISMSRLIYEIMLLHIWFFIVK